MKLQDKFNINGINIYLWENDHNPWIAKQQLIVLWDLNKR